MCDYTKNFKTDVFKTESDYITARRHEINLSEQDQTAFGEQIKKIKKDDPTNQWNYNKGHVGLAFSGGGIRSATFNLGILQALAKTNVLRFCDYLSTVSGGGYIGACLTSLLDHPEYSVTLDKFPFRYNHAKEDQPEERESEAVLWLREHSNYLIPDMEFLGPDFWRLISLYLSGLVLTNFTTVSLTIFLAYFLHLLVGPKSNPAGFSIHLLCVALFVFILLIVVRWGAERFSLSYFHRRVRDRWLAGLAVLVAILISVSGVILLAAQLPVFAQKTSDWFGYLLDGGTVLSLLGLLMGLKNRKDNLLGKGLKGLFFISWVALLPILLAQLVRYLWMNDPFDIKVFCIPLLLVLAVVLLAVGWLTNTNWISLHSFYRDRISEAYRIRRFDTDQKIFSNEPPCLKDLHARGNGGLYHLINTTLNIPSSENPKLRGRGSDSFIFSKYYCGSESTGYRKTEQYEKGETKLSTAIAVSGAALSPEMGQMGNKITTFILTLLNIRLNRWMPNPDPSLNWKCPPVWPYYFVKELLDKGAETDRLLNLSDGGHYENLGVYELIKRRCEVIIASDAGADPDFNFEDLGNLMRKVRIDMGVEIKINLSELRRRKRKNIKAHFSVGTILYADKTEGVLIYIKSSMTGKESEDIISYRRANATFPDESTADQFFNEAQFESYRELGYLTAKAVFS